MEARTFPFSRTMSCPATRALPEVGGSRVVSIRTSVVFPAPFGPRRPYVSPDRTSNVTASSATVSPNFRVSFSAWIGFIRADATSIRARLDHEGLAGDDGQPFGGQPDGERAQVSALESPVAARRELRTRADRHDPRMRAGVRPRLRPDLHALSQRKRGEAFFRHLDAQPRRLELQGDDRLAGRDPLAHPVVAREHHAGRLSDESAFLFEMLHLSEPGMERVLFGADLSLLRFSRADRRLRAVAPVLHGLQVCGRRDPLAHEPRNSLFFARDLREVRLESRDLFPAAVLPRAALRHLALEIGGVLGEPGLFDARDRLTRAHGLAFVGNGAHEAAAAREREREALFFRDGQKPDSAPRVVFPARERAVTPGARHSDCDRHAHPHGFLHWRKTGRRDLNAD